MIFAGLLLMAAIEARLPLLGLLLTCLVSWTALAETDERQSADGAQLTFRTMDDNTQQVNPDEIWRIRGAATSDEPPGAIVIDYAFERLYVKDSLANVVEKVSGMRPLKKFTLPGGAPVYIVPSKVIGITRAIAHQSHPNAHAVIVAREGQTQVQESPEAIKEALMK